MVLKILTSKRFMILATGISIVDVIFSIYLMNVKLVIATITGIYPLHYKWSLLIALLYGVRTSMPLQSQITLVLISILTGLNISFLIVNSILLNRASNQKWVIGGSSIFGTTIGGCASCGIPLLSIIGTTGSIAVQPFVRESISYLSYAIIISLLISFHLLMRSAQQATCKLQIKK